MINVYVIISCVYQWHMHAVTINNNTEQYIIGYNYKKCLIYYQAKKIEEWRHVTCLNLFFTTVDSS